MKQKPANLMKTRKRIILFVVTFLFVLTVSGCGSSKKELDFSAGDNAEFVKTVAQAITNREDTPDLFVNSSSILYDLEAEPLFQPFFAMMYMKAQEDENDPSLVHYSCRIPGLVGTCFNMAYQTYYGSIWRHSKWVSAEGDVRVVTDKEGNRRIDLSETDSAFTAYATLRYLNPLVFEVYDIDLDIAMKDSNRTDVLNLLLNLGVKVYSPLSDLSEDEYAEQVVIPELNAVVNNITDVRRSAVKAEENKNLRYTHKWNASNGVQRALYIFGFSAVTIIPAILFLVMFFSETVRQFFKDLVYKHTLRNKNAKYDDIYHAMWVTKYPKDKELLREVAFTNPYPAIRAKAITILPYPQERDTLVKIARKDQNSDVVEEAIGKLLYPQEREVLVDAAMRGYTDAVKKLPYSQERKQLTDIALNAGTIEARSKAVEMLPYPEERDVLRKIAENDTSQVVRQNAQNKLTGQEDRDIIRKMAISDPDEKNREDLLKKLPYPEEKDVFIKAAKSDKNRNNRGFALEKLSYPQERESLIRAAGGDEWNKNREMALNKLPYPGEKKTWAKAALEYPDKDIRRMALEKLSYRQDGKTLLQIVQKQNDLEELRRTALSRIPYAKERELYLQIAAKDIDQELRHIAIQSLTYPEDRDVLVKVAKEDSSEENRDLAIQTIPYLKEPEFFVQMVVYGMANSEDDQIKCAIALARNPQNADKILRFLCDRIQRGMRAESGAAALTLAGWSAAALGRILAMEMKPQDIELNQSRLEPALDRHNELVEKILDLQKKLKPYEGKRTENLSTGERSQVENWIFEINNLHYKLERGIGNFMMDNGDMPFAYLTHILRDSQAKIPRFIKQGIIMGLVDWLSANASHPKAKELLDIVIAIRADIIRSDNDLSFFEVRGPSDSTREEYAVLLADVLHCANPSVSFADPAEMLAIAEEEVPGCMEMLRVCPLRLIDPVNRQTLGFYKFKPYIHAMWVQFQPPEGIGKVISRYHEVDDRTKPLSSGLNLQLFRDPYAVIPTIFHEFQHFKGDPNEASVFLKTQMFSISFYKKYRKANARADGVFAQMTNMLGLPPEVEKVSVLNKAIRDCYGVQTTREEADKHADSEIQRLNLSMLKTNQMESVDKQETFPQFAEGQDEKNRDLIRDILIRHDTVPKSITEQEFRGIVEG